jgi:hypothetical protein
VGSISVRDASAKFGVPATTISGWVAAGAVRVVRNPEKRGQAKLVAEADVAALAARYSPGRGHWRRHLLDGVLNSN